MPRVLIASTNPTKINSAREGFSLAFPNHSFDFCGLPNIPSGVPDQPVGDDQTLAGALNRARAARHANPDGDFFVGMEGGVQDRDDLLEAFAWIVVLDRRGTLGRSRTATFELPPPLTRLVRSGVELGHASDQLFGVSNSKHTGGAVGLLTNGLIDRTAYYTHAVVLALVPFLATAS